MVVAVDFDFEKLVNDAMRKASEKIGHVNVLIAGKTGVGKSTLINAVFQGNFATTGQGRPVTPKTRKISKEGSPLSIFDTRGLEAEDYSKTLNSLKDFISRQTKTSDVKEHLHIAWVCICEDIRRVEPAESEKPILPLLRDSLNRTTVRFLQRNRC